MGQKKFRIAADEIKQLVGDDDNGGCIASDMITVDGCPVGYMYREPPMNDSDTGWRFMAGDESDEYMDDVGNHEIYEVNTVANYDREIIPLLSATIGSAFARHEETGVFEPVESPVDPDECLHPDYPIVSGDFALTPEWSIVLPHKFNRRVEEGSLVLWRLGTTLYFNAWSNEPKLTIEERLTSFQQGSSANAFEQQLENAVGYRKYSYRLVEDGVHVLHGFAVSENEHLQIAVYFDDEADIELARSILASLKKLPE